MVGRDHKGLFNPDGSMKKCRVRAPGQGLTLVEDKDSGLSSAALSRIVSSLQGLKHILPHGVGG